MTIIYAVVLLGILIFVHELGHFLVAKSVGVKVLKFSLGFGPKVIGKTYGDTEYLLSAFPLGGYVKMLGQEDMPSEAEEISESEKHRAYNFQPIWKRFSIILSGPLFNLLFAGVLFFFMIALNGVPFLLPEIGEVNAGSPAFQHGLAKGDRIIQINSTPINRWDDMTAMIHKSPGIEVTLKIKRGDEIIDIALTPEKKVAKDIFGEGKEVGLIGILPSGRSETKKEGIAGAAVLAVTRTWDISVLTVVSIIKLFQRIIPADTIGGPIMIFQMAGQQAAQGAMNFFTFMAIISINLGVLNLFPVPVLDGGHLLFLGIEAVRRKPLSDKVILMSQRVGIALLVSLMVFALYNDIGRLISGKMLP
ncbi:MAG: RIP metalloprotease RseP [Nitrospirae bacterium]|nr:MAG: RIP metalloprotease RseP [Nitrospirota bacterium]